MMIKLEILEMTYDISDERIGYITRKMTKITNMMRK